MEWERFKVEHDDERPSEYFVTAKRRGYVLRAEILMMEGNRPVLVGLAASPAWESKSTPPPKPLSLREFRRLPFATFAEASREAVAAIREHQEGRFVSMQDFGDRIRRARPPRGEPNRTGKNTRYWTQLAKAYMDEVRRGEPYPAAALAKRMGQPASKVRVWVHRMKKAGLIESASDE